MLSERFDAVLPCLAEVGGLDRLKDVYAEPRKADLEDQNGLVSPGSSRDSTRRAERRNQPERKTDSRFSWLAPRSLTKSLVGRGSASTPAGLAPTSRHSTRWPFHAHTMSVRSLFLVDAHSRETVSVNTGFA